MKGWCQLALKVFLYTCGAVVGGLCVAFGIGLLTAGPASAATSAVTMGAVGPGPVSTALTGAVPGPVKGVGTVAGWGITTRGSPAGGVLSTAPGLTSPLPGWGGTGPGPPGTPPAGGGGAS